MITFSKNLNQTAALLLCVLVLLSPSLLAQNSDALDIKVSPENPTLQVGESLQLKANLVNNSGEVLPDTIIFFARNGDRLTITNEGLVQANFPGTYTIVAMRPGSRETRVRKNISINVAFPPIANVEIQSVPTSVYAKSTVDFPVVVTDAADLVRENPSLKYGSSNKDIAEVRFGKLIAKKPGKFTITVDSEGKKATFNGEVKANPTARLEIANTTDLARTGDVITFTAKAFNSRNTEVSDAPINYSYTAEPDDNLGNAASGQVSQEGKFVANHPGLYTLTARSGDAIEEQVVRIEPRNVQRDLTVVGHGAVLDVHTSDLWIWEGVDGRDYAITGTWGANGDTYFWDVTDPSNIVSIDTVRVDARTINDVKISEDGKLAVITREGASTRRNGLVILDVTNPREVKILSEYTEDLTGGVHNTFIYENHIYAVNNGRKYDIINIDDPKNPRTVSQVELDTPGHSIHDVWVEDGIAYSSNWRDGIVAFDVGSKSTANAPEMAGVVGSPENPVMLGSYAYPNGRNHAAFPFKSKSTGDFYVIGGDEIFPYGLPSRENPVPAAGWIHFVKFDSWDNPQEVARYEVPEAGTHNMWVYDDLLFVAYYNAGLRIVDISGELMGNLYDQGREIARFLPQHPDAIIPNSPFTWGPQPYKGHIFISDWNTGLWAVKVEDLPISASN